MKPKERIRAILDRKPVDRIPVDLWMTPEICTQLQSYYHLSDRLSLYQVMGLDKIIWVFPEYLEERGNRNQWGTEMVSIQAGNATYIEHNKPALKDVDRPEAVQSFAYWPDPDKYDYTSAAAKAKQAADEFAVIGPWISLFEIYCDMRGMEQAMIDLATESELVNTILDQIECCQTQMLQRFLDTVGQYVDMVFLSDDMGSQEALLFSTVMWDRHLKDRMKRWCTLIHSYGKKVFYHSDGACEPLLERLIDCGIDIFNPIQHICPGMDMDQLKRKYGNSVVFHGGVDNQSVLPFGTSRQVRDETHSCLAALSKGLQGYICCSCHNVQPGTPIENILVMIETVRAWKE